MVCCTGLLSAHAVGTGSGALRGRQCRKRFCERCLEERHAILPIQINPLTWSAQQSAQEGHSDTDNESGSDASLFFFLLLSFLFLFFLLQDLPCMRRFMRLRPVHQLCALDSAILLLLFLWRRASPSHADSDGGQVVPSGLHDQLGGRVAVIAWHVGRTTGVGIHGWTMGKQQQHDDGNDMGGATRISTILRIGFDDASESGPRAQARR
jgi:hypothetical protein